MKAKGVTDSP